MLAKWIICSFLTLLPVSSFLVIAIRNSILCSICLITCFVLSAIFLLFLGCEFFAFLFLMVYVGAIAVLFLFVLMMLELKESSRIVSFFNLLFSLFVPCFFYLEALPFIRGSFSTLSPYSYDLFGGGFYSCCDYFYLEDNCNEIESIGQLLYTRYVLQFLLVGLILTLAVVCVGILTTDRCYHSVSSKSQGLVISRSF